MIPHTIRLREPWESEPGTGGSVVYRRRFNLPTNLDPWERVSLEVDRTLCAGQVTLNGTPLGEIAAGQFFAADVTAHLQPQNELCVAVDSPHPSPLPEGEGEKHPHPGPSTKLRAGPLPREKGAEPGSPIGEVRLVIRAAQNPQ